MIPPSKSRYKTVTSTITKIKVISIPAITPKKLFTSLLTIPKIIITTRVNKIYILDQNTLSVKYFFKSFTFIKLFITK